MFFLKILITGILIGFAGFFLLERWFRNYLLRQSFKMQIVAILILGLFLCITFVTSFAGLIADAMNTDVVFVWLISLFGLFSANTIVILIVVFYVVMLGGYDEFARLADEVLTPLIAGLVGFLFGMIYPEQDSLFYIDSMVVATINFMGGFFSGLLSGGVAFITKKLLGKMVV